MEARREREMGEWIAVSFPSPFCHQLIACPLCSSPVVDEAFGEAVVEALGATGALAVEFVGEDAAVDVGQGSHATGVVHHLTLLPLSMGLSPGSPDAPASLDPAILDLAKQETKK